MELIAGTVGVGWIIWRGVDYLPKELIFELHYLGEVSSFSTATAIIFELMKDRLLVQSQFLSTSPSHPWSNVQL
jgi:hypothetical protein